MSAPALGVGIIGFGFMGHTHTYGLINIPLFYNPAPFKVKHISVCTPVAAERAAAEGLGYYRKVVADYRELIDDPEIDVIAVSSPNRFHKEQLIAAIQAGKHLYCDKPVVASLEEAEEVFEAMRACNYRGKSQVVLQYRYFPATLRARQLMDSGFTGRVFHYRGGYLHSSNIDPAKPLNWKSEKSQGGGGSLFDMGAHTLDMMTHLLGDVASINALCETFIKERKHKDTGEIVPVDTDDVALMLLRHKSGAVGTLEATKFATGVCDELRFEIHGELGAIRFNLMEPNWLEVYDVRDDKGPYGGQRGFKRIECVQQYGPPGGGFPNPKFSIGWIRAHMHCLYSFLECIALDKTPSPSLEDGIRLQRVMVAGYRSAESGRWVDVDSLALQ
ncbi:MAG: Gfo/Idh/MocA family oxidoreductase [Candidatus Hydrogenedentes bacterium]|nr:Gfo/Idh/MocA family oxidoreductase [Candidatus Hydrogenedentota bacterium]